MIRIISYFFLTISFSSFAQKSEKRWSLEDCIEYAYKNNLQLLQSKNNTQLHKNMLQQSKYDRLPSVASSVSWNNSYGRSIDYITNGYTDQNSSNINYGIGASVDLFDGFRKKHQIRKNKFNLQVALLSVEATKEDLTLKIMSFYLNILYAQEQLQIEKDNLVISKKQKKRIQELVNVGKVSKGSLLEQQSQISKKKSLIVEAENNLNLAYLNLYQLLDIQKGKEFLIKLPNINDESKMNMLLLKSSNNYKDIIEKRPVMKSFKYQIKSALEDIAIAKSGYYPIVSLSANIGSGYSNLRYNYTTSTTNPSSIVKEDRMSFKDQYKLNLNKSWGISLKIPIFSKLKNRTAVNNATLQFEDIQIQQQITHNKVYKELQQVYAKAIGAVKKYKAAKETAISLKETFRYVEEKYQLGMVSNFDYNESLNNLMRARSSMIQAKYEYLFRIKILDYYNRN